ncbi:hypothetical protein [Sphingomonas colocasiae]|uniref:hypothetical protein n=1 Tax=Sphingomonas colocasiae TaxID=1848973 RepID=UPI001FEB8F28|nr:hypothetical protein [Sphingomonas colocasiae]
MNVAKTSVIERIARVPAAQRLSGNADGSQPSAAPDVDEAWPDYQADAIAVLKTMREADEDMAAVGDPATWERMIAAALGTPLDTPDAFDPPASGNDPLHDDP